MNIEHDKRDNVHAQIAHNLFNLAKNHALRVVKKATIESVLKTPIKLQQHAKDGRRSGITIAEAREAIDAVVKRQSMAKRAAAKVRANRTRYYNWNVPSNRIMMMRNLYSGWVADKLERNRRYALAYPVSQAFTHGETDVEWTTKVEDCGIVVKSWMDWDVYSKGTRFPAKIFDVTIKAKRVTKHELPDQSRMFDGALILHSAKCAVDSNCNVWEVVLAKKSRGVSWKTEPCFIAEFNGDFAVGKTVKAAVGKLQRKVA